MIGCTQPHPESMCVHGRCETKNSGKKNLNINATPLKCGRVEPIMHEGLAPYHS